MGIIDDKLQEKLDALPEELGDAALEAILLNSMKNLDGLSYIVLGPPRSGKTSLAADLAEVLSDAGVIEKKVIFFDPFGKSQADVEKTAADAENAVIAIDSESPAALRDTLPHFLRAIEDGRTAVILTMTKDEADLSKILPPEFIAHFSGIIKTEKTFSMEEIKEFHKSQDQRWEIQARHRRKENLIEAWRNLKTVDVTLGKEIKAHKPAKFRRTETPKGSI